MDFQLAKSTLSRYRGFGNAPAGKVLNTSRKVQHLPSNFPYAFTCKCNGIMRKCGGKLRVTLMSSKKQNSASIVLVLKYHMSTLLKASKFAEILLLPQY